MSLEPQSQSNHCTNSWNNLNAFFYQNTNSIFNLESWLRKRDRQKFQVIRNAENWEAFVTREVPRGQSKFIIQCCYAMPGLFEGVCPTPQHIAQRLKPKQVGGKE